MVNLIVTKNEVFRCNNCNREFETPHIYEEKHGLDNPPYERVAVCPDCKSDDFCLFNKSIDKIDVALKLLYAIAALNRFCYSINDLLGSDCRNSDLGEGIGSMLELTSEMFDFMPVEIEKAISKMQTKTEVERIFNYLKG